MPNAMPNTTMILGLIVVLTLAPSASALSPWFSSSFQYAHHTLQRFAGCHSLEPISNSKMNETTYLISQITRFYDVANFDDENIMANINLFKEICTDGDALYAVPPWLPSGAFEQKVLRCATLDDIMNKIYPEMRRAALNSSFVMNFTDLDYQPIKIHGNTQPVGKNLVSFINTAWIQSKFLKDNMCSIVNSLTDHLLRSRKTSNSTERVSQAVASEGRFVGAIKYWLEPLFSLYTRMNLALNTEVGEARMAVASGYNSATSFFKDNYSNLRRFLSRRVSNDTKSIAAPTPTPTPVSTPIQA